MLWRKAKVSIDEKKIDELLSRAVVDVIDREDLRRQLLSGRQLRIKLGIDPTSPNLHLGRSIPILKLRDFQELGHQVVFIVGDFTGVIGDTSDKDSERPMLSPETIAENARTYFAQAGKILDMSKVEKVSNASWLSKLTYGEIGVQADQFSVADFIARENIKRRLDAGTRVSLREVLYPLMQGYDSVAVRADVELGGTDQRFNLLAGRTLQAYYKQRPQNIVMNELIPGLDGRKMSSSWGNTINVTDEPSDMYGKVMSLHDDLILTYFKFCTRVPLFEVEQISEGLSSGTLHPKVAKQKLARAVVSLYAGEQSSEEAERTFTQAFIEGTTPDAAPEVFVSAGSSLVDILIKQGIVSSKSDWRRLVEEGAVEVVGGEKITDLNAKAEKDVDIKIGKKRFVKIRIT